MRRMFEKLQGCFICRCLVYIYIYLNVCIYQMESSLGLFVQSGRPSFSQFILNWYREIQFPLPASHPNNLTREWERKRGWKLDFQGKEREREVMRLALLVYEKRLQCTKSPTIYLISLLMLRSTPDDFSSCIPSLFTHRFSRPSQPFLHEMHPFSISRVRSSDPGMLQQNSTGSCYTQLDFSEGENWKTRSRLSPQALTFHRLSSIKNKRIYICKYKKEPR